MCSLRYAAAVDYLLSFADLERAGGIGRAGDSFDLARMRRLVVLLDDPDRGRRGVHIAGSKGKSSTAVMIDAILRAHGVRTGRYTSPDLHSKRERISLAGEPIAEDAFAALVQRLLPVVDVLAGEGVRPTTFELMTALAFLAFRDAAVETQIVEVGLGGRLDATNVLDEKDVVVITPLEREHTDILGDDLRAIAREKAAIARSGTPVVMALQPEPAADAVRAACAAIGAPLHEIATTCTVRRTRNAATQEFRVRTPVGDYAVKLPLVGAHQMENAVVAIRAAELWAEASGTNLVSEHVRSGLADVRLPGRVEVIGQRPRVIFDAAHTPGSAKRLAQALRDDLGVREVVLVIGVAADKDAAALAAILAPLATTVVATRSSSPRALDPAALARAFADVGAQSLTDASPERALETARGLAGDRGTVVVTGSFYLVAELRTVVLGHGLPATAGV